MSKDKNRVKNRVNTSGLTRDCLECGKEFIADESGQECCDNVCASAWYGWDDGYYEDDTDEWIDDCDYMED